MIQKRGNKFVVTNKSGTKVLGTHPSKEAAAKQLAAIEISKAKHMQHENKRFKDFRNTLTESEYKETLTGYPNRGINTEDGPMNFGTERVAQINAMLNAISRSTFQSPNEAFIRIKTRLNLLMLDFPWTPYLWSNISLTPPQAPSANATDPRGTITVPVTLFGRVDGVDSMTGNVVMNGKANPTAGLKEFALTVSIEIAEDGLYRVTAKLGPKTEPVFAEEGVEHDGDTIKEEAEQIDELSKKTKDAYVAKRGSQLSSMLSGHTRGKQLTGKQQANAVKGIKQAMGGNKDKSKLPKLLPRMATFGEELVGGQKKLDVNKNKRLDAHDFALLRNKKKSVKEYTEMMPGIPLMQPDPTMSQADQTGKGKRFHKKALKSSMEEAAKKPVKKADPHAGARSVINKQKAIKRTLDQHGMRW
jgi:hypothetical protein